MAAMIEIQDLLDFISVVKHRGFTRAADAGKRSQSSLSQSVAKLEDTLKTTLLARNRREVTLTEAGTAFHEKAVAIVREWGELQDMAGRRQQQIEGPVRVGAGETAVLYLLPGPVEAFRKRHPRIQVIIRNQPLKASLSMLKSGALDFAVRGVDRPVPGFRFQPSPGLTFARVVIAPPGHSLGTGSPLKLADLARQPWIMPWKDSATRRLLETQLRKIRARPQIALEAGGWEVVKRYVTAGLGIAIVPELCLTQDDRARLVIRPLDPPLPPDRYGLLLRRGVEPSGAARALMRLIVPAWSDTIAERGHRPSTLR
jgi:DNA-binding transcriptional LysR family regulator